MDPASGARRCFGAQRLRLLRELAGAHRRVRARQHTPPTGVRLVLMTLRHAGMLPADGELPAK